MILTNIINTKKLSPTEVQLLTTNTILKDFAKEKHNFSSKKVLINPVKQVLTNYIISIHTSQTNTLVSVTDIKGKVIISLSSGSLKLKKKTKKNSTFSYYDYIKTFITKS